MQSYYRTNEDIFLLKVAVGDELQKQTKNSSFLVKLVGDPEGSFSYIHSPYTLQWVKTYVITFHFLDLLRWNWISDQRFEIKCFFWRSFIDKVIVTSLIQKWTAFIMTNVEVVSGNEYIVHDVYLTSFEYILVRNTCISDEGIIKTGEIYLLHSEFIHSHLYFFQIRNQICLLFHE